MAENNIGELYKKVSEYITQGGRPEYQTWNEKNSNTPPPTYTKYNTPLNKDSNGYGALDYYRTDDGVYTRDLSKVAKIEFNSKTGKITSVIPDKWANDEYVKSFANTDFLKTLSSNWKADKDIKYQDPYDENKKYNTEDYVKEINDALKSRVAALDAVDPTKDNLLRLFGGDEKKNALINSIGTNQIIMMSATGDKNDSYVAIPEWLLDRYPQIKELSSFSNGFVKAQDLRDNILNTTKGLLSSEDIFKIKKESEAYMNADTDPGYSADPDKNLDEFAKNVAFYDYIHKTSPILEGGEVAALTFNAASHGFFYGLVNGIQSSLDLVTSIVTLGNAKNVRELELLDEDEKTLVEQYMEITHITPEEVQYNYEYLDYVTNGVGSTGLTVGTYIGAVGESLAEISLMSVLSGMATEKVTAALSAKGAASTTEAIVDTATSVSKATAIETEVSTAAKNAASIGKLASVGGEIANLSAKAKNFFSMTIGEAGRLFTDLYGGTASIITHMSPGQVANIMNTAVKSAKFTAGVNSAMGVMNNMLITAVVTDKNTLRRVLTSEATDDETKTYLKQVAFNFAKLEAVGALAGVAAQTKVGQAVSSKIGQFGERISQKVVGGTRKISSPWLKFREWFIKRKMQQAGPVSNATAQANEALGEAALRNVAREYGVSLPAGNVTQTADFIADAAGKGVVVADSATANITRYQEWKADFASLENSLTGWGDVDAEESRLVFSISSPDINPVLSQMSSEVNNADSRLLAAEKTAGLLSNDIVKGNKGLGKNEYNYIYSSHSKEVSDYAFLRYKVQHEEDICIADGISFDDSPSLKSAKEELATAAEKLSPDITGIIDNDLIPSLQKMTHDLMDRMIYDWKVYPRELVEGLRNEGRWGKDGGHYIRLVSQKDLATGTYMPFDKMVSRDSTIDLTRSKGMELKYSTWIGNGIREMIRESAIAIAGKRLLDAGEKATGVAPEVLMSGSKTAAVRKLKEYRVQLNNALRDGLASFTEDMVLNNGGFSAKDVVADKDIATTGGVASMDLDQLRSLMNDKGLITTNQIFGERDFLKLYRSSSPEAKSLMDKYFPSTQYTLGQCIEREITFYSKNRHGAAVSITPHAYAHITGGTESRGGTRLPIEVAGAAVYDADFSRRIPGEKSNGSYAAKVVYKDNEIVLRFNDRDGIINVYDILLVKQNNLNLYKAMSNSKLRDSINKSFDKLNSLVTNAELPDYSQFAELRENNPDFYNNVSSSIDIANATNSKDVSSSPVVKEASKNYSEDMQSLQESEIFSKNIIPKKYNIDEKAMAENIDSAIDGLLDLIRSNAKASQAVSSIIVLQGGHASPVRTEFTILDNILSKEGRGLFGDVIDKVSKDVVNDMLPSDLSLKASELKSLYVKMKTLIVDKFESRLASCKNQLETVGERIDSATVTELLDRFNSEIMGYKTDDAVVKTLDNNGEIQYEKVSPSLAKIYNNRPVYTPMSKPMQILSNLALMKRISTTNLNPRSFAKQAFSDPALAFASIGAIPGTLRVMDEELVNLFGGKIAAQIRDADPYRYENIVAIHNRDGISLAEAVIKNANAISATQLPFTTMSREALTQANANKYNTEDALKIRRETATRKMNEALTKASQKFGKPNDIREEYVRKLAGEKAFVSALKKGYNYKQAESFRQHAVDNATTNFRQKHTVFNNLRSTTPYLTSGISGAKSFWKMFEMDPVGVTSRIFTGFTIPIIYFLGEILADDDARKKYLGIPEYQRENHIPIMINGEIVLIPIGEELGGIVNPMRHAVESIHNESQYDFWSLMLNDVVGLLPVDLTGFTDPEMWDSIINDSPSFLEVMENGISKVLAQSMPPIVQSVYMATTNRDLYTGNRVDTGYVSIDDDGNAVIQSYSQSEFSKAVANLIGGDARVVEKVTSGIIGTTALHVLDTVTSAVQYVNSGGKEGSLITGVSKALSDIAKPFSSYDTASVEKRWSSNVSELYNLKESLENDETYRKYNEKIAQTSNSEERQKLINKRNEILSQYQNKVEKLVSWYRDSGGSLNKEKFSTAVSLLVFEDALRADRSFMELNTSYSDAYKQAMQTLSKYGIKNPDGLSMLGYIYTDKDGNNEVKMWNPSQIQIIYDQYYAQEDIHRSRIEAIVDNGREDSIKNLRKKESSAEQPYWDKYNSTGKLSQSEWNKIDDLRKDFNMKVVDAIKGYVDEYGANYVLSSDAVQDYLNDIIKVPSSYEKIKGRFVSSDNGKLNKQTGFAESYIKTIFGVK